MQPIIARPGRAIPLLAWAARAPKRLTLTLLLVGLYFSVAAGVRADEGTASAAIEPSVGGGRDPWLSGPELRLYPADGLLRPFVVVGAGRMSEVARLGIEDPTNRFRAAPYAGRAGGGLELRLGDRSSLSLEGSYLQPDGTIAQDAAATAGLKLEIDF